MYNCIALQKCSTFKNSEINTKEIKKADTICIKQSENTKYIF